ncbi:Uncharacterised protein [Moraxella caviae]|uniref:Uncharacterized protein n=1 Tax=Moraxella caviae TaxID=34060 RepID=A0A378R979_9GAMM|nr:Uncharacterised protein [Moraxella caviae]VEW12824.1 Uncharacterised protein [Moraxella caviae]
MKLIATNKTLRIWTYWLMVAIVMVTMAYAADNLAELVRAVQGR